jgi:ketosteroid isomerase-like protein
VERHTAASLLDRLHSAQNAYYGGGDDAPLRALLAPDVTWHVPGDNAIAGDHRGLGQVLAYMSRRRDLARNSMRLYPLELLVGEGQHVASRTDGTATVDGIEHRWSTLGLYRLDDARVLECWLLPLDPATFDLVWRHRGENTR